MTRSIFYCPRTDGLECSQVDREEEFYRQMHEAMLYNQQVQFLTRGVCPVYACDCMKLREYLEKKQKQR